MLGLAFYDAGCSMESELENTHSGYRKPVRAYYSNLGDSRFSKDMVVEMER